MERQSKSRDNLRPNTVIENFETEIKAKYEKLSKTAQITVANSSIYRETVPFHWILSHLEDHKIELNPEELKALFEEIKNSRVIVFEDNTEEGIENLEATFQPEYMEFLTAKLKEIDQESFKS